MGLGGRPLSNSAFRIYSVTLAVGLGGRSGARRKMFVGNRPRKTWKKLCAKEVMLGNPFGGGAPSVGCQVPSSCVGKPGPGVRRKNEEDW